MQGMDQEFHRNLLSRNGGFTNSHFYRGLGTPFSFSLTRLASYLNPLQQQHHHPHDDHDDDEDDDDDGVSYDDDTSSPFRYYSRPIVVLDVIWNLAFVLVSCLVLLTTLSENPKTPLRLWIGGYALQCLLHVGFIWIEFQRRSFDDDFDALNFDGVSSSFSLFHSSIMKRLESVNTVISSIWWVFGFYWIVMGGQPLLQDSPRLYWLSVVFLAFDVFFMIFCIAMACIVFFVFFCFFPFISTVAYAMRLGDGASENDIEILPKYRYGHSNTSINLVNVKSGEDNLMSRFNNSDSVPQLSLHPDDSECCICLYKYVDGVELCVLPCNHHFHHGCITKWLRINATCPLCKFNILRGGDSLV